MGFFRVSLTFPNIRVRNESEKVIARNNIALRIPRFITRDIGLNFLLAKTSLAYNARNKKAKKTIISFKVLRRNESLE